MNVGENEIIKKHALCNFIFVKYTFVFFKNFVQFSLLFYRNNLQFNLQILLRSNKLKRY